MKKILLIPVALVISILIMWLAVYMTGSSYNQDGMKNSINIVNGTSLSDIDNGVVGHNESAAGDDDADGELDVYNPELIDRGRFVASSMRHGRIERGINITGIVNFMNRYNDNALGGMEIHDYEVEYDGEADVWRIIGGDYSLSLVLDEFGDVLFAAPDSGLDKDGERIVSSSLINAMGSGSYTLTSLINEAARQDLKMKLHLASIKSAIAGFLAEEPEIDTEFEELPELPPVRLFTPDDMEEPYVEPMHNPNAVAFDIDSVWEAREKAK